jgi:hypothetical protein
MKHVKIYEFFKKKPNFKKNWSTGELYNAEGNFLTKQEQPEDNFDPYLYDNGFGDRYYICKKCDSYKLIPIPKGGMQPPDWVCDNCGEMNYAPMWKSPEEYKKWLEEKELKKAMNKYNL